MLPIFRGVHASWRCGEASVPRCDADGRGLRVPVPGPWRPPGKRRSAKSPVNTGRMPDSAAPTVPPVNSDAVNHGTMGRNTISRSLLYANHRIRRPLRTTKQP